MHTREGPTGAWHPPGSGTAGLLWEAPSCTTPSLATTVATWRKGKGHPRGVALQPLEPGWSLPETLVCLSHDLSPKLWVPQGWPVDTFGIVSSVCTSRHVGTPWRDLPAPKVTVLPALVIGCAAQGSSQCCPRGGGTSAPASTPLHFSLPGSFVSRE